MGRKRKLYTDKFKLDVVREALRASEKQAEIAVKHDISPGTLSEWIPLTLPFWSDRKGTLFVSRPAFMTFALCEGIQKPLNSLLETGVSKGFVFSFSMFCSF